jgi:hypothetical protein
MLKALITTLENNNILNPKLNNEALRAADFYSLLGSNTPQLAAYLLLGFDVDTPGLAPG